MSSGRQDLCWPEKWKSVDDTSENHKESALSYPRDFLLSLAKLDTCKRLPDGFDSLVFGGENGLDGLVQSRHSSDSSILSSNKSQPSWQNAGPGLLGSFASQRVYEHAAGTFASQIQEKSYHLLKRSSAPYCPPHISKAKLQSKRQSNDLHNDETFDSSNYLSPERAEDERRRRDSFELMRKEQQKAIQEKKNLGQQKENSDPDIANECYVSDKSKPPTGVDKASAWHSSSSKPSSATQRVTPHFERTSLIEDSATKSLAASPLLEGVIEENIMGSQRFNNQSTVYMPLYEHFHVKDDLTWSSILSSSNFDHQSLKEVVKTAVGISTGQMKGDSEMHEASHDEANTTSFSSGRDELLNKLMTFTSPSADENSNKLYTFNESTVTPGVLTCNDIEQSIFLDGNVHHSTHRQYDQGQRTCDIEDNGQNSLSVCGVSQLLNSLLDKGKGLSDSETSSILSTGSPHGLYLYEAGDDGKHSNALDTEISKNKFTHYGTLGAGLSQELLSTELETSQEVCIGRMTKNDALEPVGRPLPFNNNAISLTVDGTIGINHADAVFEHPVCFEKSGLSMSEGDQCIGNYIPMEVVYPADSSDGKANSFDDICLPDEDSLITVADWIFPEDLISVPGRISPRADLFASNTPVDITQKLTAPAVYSSDERYMRSNLEGPTSSFSMYDRVGLKTHHNLQPQLSHSLPFHSQASQDSEFFHPSKSLKAHPSSVVEPMGSRTDPYEPPPYRYSPTNVLPYPFQCPHVGETWFNHRRTPQLLELMPIPRNYPPANQVNGMSNPPLPHQLVNQMPYHAEEVHQIKGHPMNYQLPIYHGFKMQTLDHTLGIGSNQAVFSGLYDIGSKKRAEDARNRWPGNIWRPG